MVPHSHVIVGDGITALAFLETCRGRDLQHITVIGRLASQLGRGIAYAKGEPGTPWRYAYLLNSPADDIDPAFATWLADRWNDIETTMRGRKPDWLSAAKPLVEACDLYGVNAPREFYGDFMEAQAHRLIADLRNAGTDVTLIDDIATGLAASGPGVSIQTAAGRCIAAQSADVAPGGPEAMRFDGDDGPFSAPSVFGHEHRIAQHIQSGAEIFCIGGNAAMLDVLRLCQSLLPDEKVNFAFCAPEGEVPPPLVPRLPRKMTVPNLTAGHKTADSFLSEVRREIDAAEAAGDERREIRAGFRAYFLERPLHSFIADPTEAATVSKALRFWLRGGTRDTIFDMRTLVAAGRVTVLKGHVLAIENASDGAVVIYKNESDERRRRQTGFAVNCAGAGPNSAFDALTEDMLQKSLISVAPAGGLATGPGCQTRLATVRYLSPAVTQIGDEVVAMPLYDAHMLRTYVSRAAGLP